VFLLAVLAALEHRDVAIVDVPGALMQVDMGDELVHMRLTGIMVDILLEIDYEMYSPFIVKEKKRCCIVSCSRHCTGHCALLICFGKSSRVNYRSGGFELNPYDSCVANKMINGKQCTIGWHVDDLHISHVDPAVVDNIIDMMDEQFGKETPRNDI
jgi:hypothetical protein